MKNAQTSDVRPGKLSKNGYLRLARERLDRAAAVGQPGRETQEQIYTLLASWPEDLLDHYARGCDVYLTRLDAHVADRLAQYRH